MTVSKPLRFVLQLIMAALLIAGAVDFSHEDYFNGAIWVIMGAGLWWVSRRRTAP